MRQTFEVTMPIPLIQVDAFTDKPFAGNPAAVCLLENKKDTAWMQTVAAEMNFVRNGLRSSS